MFIDFLFTRTNIRLNPPRRTADYDPSKVIVEKYNKVREETKKADSTDTLDNAITNINTLLSEMMT